MAFVTLFTLSFLSGSFVPLASEPYFIFLKHEGHGLVALLIFATLGNSLGGMTTYWIGRYGGIPLVTKYLKLTAVKLQLWQERLQGKGAWVAFFCFMPLIGEVIGAVLGLLKADHPQVVIFMIAGKFSRYFLVWHMWEAVS